MIYLDNAATTYKKPESVINAIVDTMKNHGANPGRSGHKIAMSAGRILYNARESISELIGAGSTMEIVLTKNATESLNLGIKGLLRENDHVISTSMEHNSVVRPIMALEKRGVEHTFVDCDIEGNLNIENLEKAIRKDTKMIVMTHGSNVSGTIMDIERVSKIANEKNIIFMVDASQTLGVLDVDVKKMNIDILAAPGHKCLFGPQGTGFLYVSNKLELEPLMEGGTGSMSEEIYQPNLVPDKYESGTPNTPGFAGLAAGIEFIKKEGLKAIREKEEFLVTRMIEGLMNIDNLKIHGSTDSKKRLGVVSFNIGEEDSGEISYILDDAFNICTRSGLHCAPMAHKSLGTFHQGTVRASLSYFTEKHEVDEFIEAVNRIRKEL